MITNLDIKWWTHANDEASFIIGHKPIIECFNMISIMRPDYIQIYLKDKLSI